MESSRAILMLGNKMKVNHTHKTDVIIGVFKNHIDAKTAVKLLQAGGFDKSSLSLLGQSYHVDEEMVGFYNMGDRAQFWGKRGAFWGGLLGLFSSGVYITLPVTAPIIMLGFIAISVAAAIEGAAVVGGLSALAAVLYSLGVPKDSIVAYEEVLKSDGFIVMAHGNERDIMRANTILAHAKPHMLHDFKTKISTKRKIIDLEPSI